MLKLNLKFIQSSVQLLSRSKTSQSPDVLFNNLNNAGILILNRPKDLNCLTTSMISKILPKLKDWEKTQSLVIAKGAGDKAFCAGGDVKLSIHKIKGPVLFWHEYNLIYLISVYPIPYVSLNDGYTMGGGLGISMPGKYRIATERTLMAMPENKIGLCPDVGGTYFLPRLKSKIGFYLGLTGDLLKGNDNVKAGLATNFVPSERLQDLERALVMCTNESSLINAIDKFSEKSEQFSLTPYLKDIEYCFSPSTVEEIMKRLEVTNNEWSVNTLETLHKVCPGSLKVTLKALNAGAIMNLEECLMMEYRLTCHATQHHDFPEGVRARLLDKDNSPQWKHRNLFEVTDQYVNNFFQKLSSGIELTIEK